MAKNVVILGSDGQLGTCFRRIHRQVDGVNLYFLNRNNVDFLYIKSKNDFKDKLAVFSPDFIINCVAYTNTWRADEDYANVSNIKDTDNWKINALAVKHLAEYCAEDDIHLIHISTDFVYRGNECKRYSEEDACSTSYMTAYGVAKYEGEWFIRNFMQNYTIFRTSWLVSPYGNNFLNKINRQILEGSDLIEIPYDEFANPTYAPALALFILTNISNGVIGTENSIGVFNTTNCWDKPLWSKYDFAQYFFGGKITPKKRDVIGNRPQYIDMNIDKLKNVFNTESLQLTIDFCLKHFNNLIVKTNN